MSTLDEFRQYKDEFFAEGHHSPLTDEQRQEFQGLAYYPENPALALEVSAQRYREEEIVQMGTSTGGVASYRRWGRFAFEVEGQRAELTIYQDAHQGHLFLPFVDATSDDETYGAGRYVDPELLDDGKVLVDFNRAYNPYCAYNENWSCPIPPAENRLTASIRAGEKNFPGKIHAH